MNKSYVVVLPTVVLGLPLSRIEIVLLPVTPRLVGPAPPLMLTNGDVVAALVTVNVDPPPARVRPPLAVITWPLPTVRLPPVLTVVGHHVAASCDAYQELVQQAVRARVGIHDFVDGFGCAVELVLAMRQESEDL